MDNASKALYIAASVLVAMLILSLVVLTFNKMGDTQTAREKENDEKNLSALNAEYEVFNKRLMYGADVISCLNKAISNNDDATRRRDPDLYIDIVVKLDVSAIEEFKVNKLEKGKLKTIDTDDDNNGALDSALRNLNSSKISTLFKSSSNILTSAGSKEFGSLSIVGKYVNSIDVLGKGTYNLLDGGKPAETALYKLSKTSEEYAYSLKAGGESYTIKWTTVFKSFRKMAFTCEKIEYNNNTGRVNKLVFQEKEKNR